MGVSVYINIGLFVKFKELPREDYSYSNTVCENESCCNFNKSIRSNFCPECGGEVVQKDFKDSSDIDLYDWVEENELEEIFDVPSGDYNMLMINTNSLDLSGWDNMGFHSLDKVIDTKYIKQFKKTHYYNKLIDSFGEDSFSMEMGVMKTAS